MAITNRVLPLKKILRNLRCSSRYLISAHTSNITADPFGLAGKPELKPKPIPVSIKRSPLPLPPASSVLKVDDAKEIFSTVSTGKLVRSVLNLQLAAFGPLVDLGTVVTESKVMKMSPCKEVVEGIVKHTLFEHFCAGEDEKAAGQVAAGLWENGIKGMLDFGLENAFTNESCDRNLKGFIQTVESTKSLPPSSVSYVVVKITAICPSDLLKKVSHLLRWEYKDKSCHLTWKLSCLPIFSKSSPLYHTPTKPALLTSQEEFDLQLAMQRLHQICDKCVEIGVPMLVDAEDTIVQPAIDYFVYSAALKYNKDDNPIICGTIQTYLKDAKERLYETSMAAEKMGIPMGFKLVRGAYMSSERSLALNLGVESPVHDTIEQTHACFNECTSFLLEKIAYGPGKVILATHNVESGKLAVAKAQELGIGKMTDKLQFAQLYGMAESLTYGLRNAGFYVSKYMPFGPVAQIMPYLVRRAHENRGILSASAHDRHLMRVELRRRLKNVTF